MEFLGIGPMELLFIILIALVLLGPKDMIKAARVVGAFITKVVRSEYWADIQQSMRMMRGLPYNLMRETGIDEELASLKNLTQTEMDTVNQEIKGISRSAQIEIDPKIDPRFPDTSSSEVLIETPETPLTAPPSSMTPVSEPSEDSTEKPSL